METLVQKALSYGETMPEKAAVCFKDTAVSYRELGIRLKGIAAQLCVEGIRQGDRVMLSAVSKPEYIAALLGIQYLGAVAVPVDKFAKADSVLDIWQAAEASLFLVDGKKMKGDVKTRSLKKMYDGAPDAWQDAPPYRAVADEQLCELLFTTGTTGKPKGVMLSSRCIYANIWNTWHGIGMLPSDVVLNPLPLNHSFGMRVLRAALFIGATLVLQNGFTFAKEIEKNIDRFDCTAMVCVPASMEVVYRQMQDQFAAVMGKLRYLEFGAGSASVDLKKKLLRELPDTRLFNTWGSTETGGAIFLDVTGRPDKLGSIGKPLEGVEFQAVDENGNAVCASDIDTAGRMALRGGMLMEGYWRAEELTGETLRDGWLFTNDLVYQDADGFVYMLGRADDIINVGGEKVSPVEVENTAQEYAEIRECACIGVPDPDGILGEVPVLFVAAENGAVDEEGLRKYLSVRMEKYKIPHEFILVDALPRNRMKKLDRKALKKLYEDRKDTELTNPVIASLLTRRSVRQFTEKPIDRRLLEMILKAGYYAPSGHNLQTWRFTVLTSGEEIQRLKETVKEQAQRAGVYFYGFENPQALVLVSNDRRNQDGVQDASCAAENMMLAAWSYGIGSVWLNPLMTLCDEPAVRALLDSYGVPGRHIVWAMVAMGYPKEPGRLLAKKEDVVVFV